MAALHILMSVSLATICWHLVAISWSLAISLAAISWSMAARSPCCLAREALNVLTSA